MAFDYWQPFLEGRTYHIYNRVGSKLKLFRDQWEYKNFLGKWHIYLGPYLKTYCFCLIPNHFHFLVQVKQKNDKVLASLKEEKTSAALRCLETGSYFSEFISDQFRRFGSSISLKHKARYKRRGALFESRIKRVMIGSEPHLVYMICYIHHNVIHHRLGHDFSAWKYTSFNAFLSKENTNIAREEILELTGGMEEFQKIHTQFRLDQFTRNNPGIDYCEIS